MDNQNFEPDAAVSRMKIDPQHIAIRDFTYPLPTERIALTPLPQRDASRLLVYHEGQIDDAHFSQLPDLLPPGATMVFNNTRVIEARVLFQKPTGGVIEIFCLEPDGQTIETALAQKKRGALALPDRRRLKVETWPGAAKENSCG